MDTTTYVLFEVMSIGEVDFVADSATLAASRDSFWERSQIEVARGCHFDGITAKVQELCVRSTVNLMKNYPEKRQPPGTGSVGYILFICLDCQRTWLLTS